MNKTLSTKCNFFKNHKLFFLVLHLFESIILVRTRIYANRFKNMSSLNCISKSKIHFIQGRQNTSNKRYEAYYFFCKKSLYRCLENFCRFVISISSSHGIRENEQHGCLQSILRQCHFQLLIITKLHSSARVNRKRDF